MPDEPTSSGPSPAKSPTDWFGAAFGLLLIAYGGYVMVQTNWTSYLGPFLVLVGVAFQPWPIVSIAGGVGLLGWAVWWTIFKAAGIGDYVYSAIAVIVGLGAIFERTRGRSRQR